MIEVRGLIKAFDNVHALDGLDMHVDKGSIYGLVGPNGAGKTTLLQHLAGVMKPDGGEVRINRLPVYEYPQTKAALAYVPSDWYYFRQARVKDMCKLHEAVYPRFEPTRFDSLASVFSLESTLAVRSLSKGMRKQLALCLALAACPEVLLLDEPLDGLDPVARRSVLGMVMEEVARRRMTVVVSSHNLRELTDVCDHVGIMEAGKMLLERSLEDLQDGFVKVQVAFTKGNNAMPEGIGIDILHRETQGRLHTLVVRGNADTLEDTLVSQGATFVNILPLSLEEIFIYEIGGVQHEE